MVNRRTFLGMAGVSAAGALTSTSQLLRAMPQANTELGKGSNLMKTFAGSILQKDLDFLSSLDNPLPNDEYFFNEFHELLRIT